MKMKYSKAALLFAFLMVITFGGQGLYADAESDLAEAMAAVADAERDLQQAQADLANAEAAYDSARSVVADWQTLAADAESDAAEAMAAVADAQTLVDGAERALEKAQADLVNAETALASAEASLFDTTASFEDEREQEFVAVETIEPEQFETETTEEEFAVTETTETAQIDEEALEEDEYSDTETTEAEPAYTDETVVAAEAPVDAQLSDGTYPLPATYTVRTWTGSKDCFWTIAGYSWVYGDPFQWRKLYDANKAKLPDQDNPNVIDEGIVLDIPSIKGETREGAWDSTKTYAPLP